MNNVMRREGHDIHDNLWEPRLYSRGVCFNIFEHGPFEAELAARFAEDS